jgi:AcrR family transcriptional regulator
VGHPEPPEPIEPPEGAEPAGSGDARRLSADERRRQLIGIGLRLLTTTPIHELSVDAVAAEAGISRSLLFHYFPSKRDFYAAVVRAACRRMLRAVDAVIEADPRPVHGVVDGLLTFVERRREPYVAFVRGAAGGDAWLLEIYDEVRNGLVDRTLAALAADRRDDARGTSPVDVANPLLLMTVRGWLALAEEMILEWTAGGGLDRDRLVDLLVEALHRVVRLLPPLPRPR